MSWDIFVQDIPAGAKSVDDVPRDFQPRPLNLRRSELIALIAEIAPFADFSNPAWGHIDCEHSNIEVSLGDNEVVDAFAFHVRGGSLSPVIVASILDRLGLRAFDCGGSDTGIFDRDSALKSMETWQRYRDHVIGNNSLKGAAE